MGTWEGSLLGPLNTRCRILLRTQKRDHNFDFLSLWVLGRFVVRVALGGPELRAADRGHCNSHATCWRNHTVSFVGMGTAEKTAATIKLSVSK